MERDFLGSANAANLGNWLNGADFVISIHDGDKDSLIGDRSPDIVRIYTAIDIYWYVGGIEAETFQVLTGMQYSMVFYGRGDQMVALFLRCKCHPLNRKIITLRTAACKSNLCWTTAKEIGHLLSCTINSLHCMASQRVDTARIAIFDSE